MKSERLFKRREMIGLRTYLYTFTSYALLLEWKKRNEHRAEIHEVFINNGYALNVRFPRRINV